MKTTANHRRKTQKRIEGHIPPEKDKSSVVRHEGGQNSTGCHQKGEEGYRPDHISWDSIHPIETNFKWDPEDISH